MFGSLSAKHHPHTVDKEFLIMYGRYNLYFELHMYGHMNIYRRAHAVVVNPQVVTVRM